MPSKNSQTNTQSIKLDKNTKAAISYFPMAGIAFLILESKDKFIRYHSLQSIFFWIVVWAINFLLTPLIPVLIGYILIPLTSLALIALSAMLAWKAYNGKEYELPYIGKVAKDQVYKKK